MNWSDRMFYEVDDDMEFDWTLSSFIVQYLAHKHEFDSEDFHTCLPFIAS